MSDACRFGLVDGARTAMRDGAIRARSRADITQNHERGSAMVPALADIRALRLLAHRVQLQVAHQPFEAQIARRSRSTHLEPLGFWNPWRSLRQRNHARHRLIISAG